jgi:tetratricopeptide (TPR) repeat protein
MSGAALFSGDLLTGVIAADQRRGRHGHLVAVPAYVLFSDAEWRRTVTANGVPDFLLEPVELASLAEDASSVRTPASLLVARNHVVGFRSRHDLMNRLEMWAEGDKFSATLLHGPGGQGKTRVADELERRLTRRRWATVWLRNKESDEDLDILGSVSVPLLIIVDYAEISTKRVAAALRVCARISGDTPVRMLLLARSRGDWWGSLRAASGNAGELLSDAVIEALPELEVDAMGRIEAYRAALTDLALALTYLPGEQDRDWKRITFDLRAQAEDVGPGVSALTLHMTALADLLDAASPGFTSSAGRSVEDRLIDHERKYWTRAAEENKGLATLSEETLLDVLAGAMLAIPDDRAGADRLLSAQPTLETKDARDSMRRLVAQLYPPPDGRPWAALQPDRLLERFVAGRLTRDPFLVDPIVEVATSAQLERLLAVYSRAAGTTTLAETLTNLCVRHDRRLAVPAIHMATRVETPAPLITALRIIGHAASTSLDSLVLMADNLPHSSHCLADWAVELGQRIVAEIRRTAAANSGDDLPPLARELDRLSSRLARQGSFVEAMTANDEACSLYRQLAETNPGAHLAELAACLNNRSERLAEFGRLTEALKVAQEAAEICRRLATLQPHGHMPEYARSLMYLGRRWQTLGNAREALSHTRRAVDIHRQMAAYRPGDYLPALATSLHNMSGQLAVLGLPDEALSVVREAVGIWQRLADEYPDAHLVDLASSLEYLADCQAALGQRGEAIKSGEVAVGIFERLADERLDAYLSDLARALHRLSIRRVDAGQDMAALTAAILSVSAYRRLAQMQRVPNRPDFASALKNLADLHHKLGLPDGAPLVAEAVGMLRTLARDQKAHLPQLAACLNNAAVMLHAEGRDLKSVQTAREAVALRRKLAAAQPGLRRVELLRSLTVLSVAEAQNGRHDRAGAALQEASWINHAMERQQGVAPMDTLWLAELGAKLAVIRDTAARTRFVGRSTPEAAARRRIFELPTGPAATTT